ncbi:MAG: ribosomal RNA small subunit methyltransferase A [Candidatus Omnitrophica bacterium]|nr:ribosomal RNA small subunit methyltransferase A [Candidatus Omnitrophota bacterium]
MRLKPKKRLGQNFLIDKNIIGKILNACAFGPSDNILEIGPGRGELTQEMAERVANLWAVEIDPGLCDILKESLRQYNNVKIIRQDILKYDPGDYFKQAGRKIKVIGNIPYYISSPIIEYLLKYRDQIEDIFLTVQKEFATRVIASAGSKDYGSFSCFARYFTQPDILFSIKKTCFYPVPKVDSAFLRLKIREKPYLKSKQEEVLFKIIRAAFSQRRKTLRNSLKAIMPAGKLEGFFLKYKIDPDSRPEKLTLQDFIDLSLF